jgi:hypothetical protein
MWDGWAMTARHRARKRGSILLVAALLLAVVTMAAGAVALARDRVDDTTALCPTTMRVVTARSFAPVLRTLAPSLETGDDCARLEIDVVDGRAAPGQVAGLDAHVWIPDDAAWAGTAGSLELAKESAAGSGTVVATSPIYMVADKTTAERVTEAGGSWLALADLVTNDSGVSLVVRDPNGSGDGLVGVGAVGAAVWLDEGMDASAEALATALPSTRTVSDQALPADEGEVGLVCEYALTRLLENQNREAAVEVRNWVVLAGSDYSAQLRYTWLPTAAAAADPSLAGPMERVLSALKGPAANEAFAAAGLRPPDGGPPPGATTELPEISAAPFEVMDSHSVDHVFATWYPEDRRSDLLVVVDVSGSMRAPAPGSDTPLIDLVGDGTLELAKLLPDDSKLALWEFGSLLDPPRDYRTLLPRGSLDAAQRRRLTVAVDSLAAGNTGTGLYDTILAAYKAAREDYRDGVPNHVVVFTDGRNEDDVETISIKQLTKQLAAAQDPQRPVELTIITFGPEADAELLTTALAPLEVYVDPLETADQVRAVFIHLAAGGVHH